MTPADRRNAAAHAVIAREAEDARAAARDAAQLERLRLRCEERKAESARDFPHITGDEVLDWGGLENENERNRLHVALLVVLLAHILGA